ncbi:DoxX family protein [Sediminivirga luteola]|uniref:DoxX family protein n=1 Tax=Sediminivirga luteola TaxID=1774748 RepID=A0A8J2TW81_9MICO|nr:DoxX family membrane protein [Sediminivirga luteola]MCI2265658.1 DoxX family membrane protein [Sediminivirga luteola]GGA07598.1 hypothetical protein GCM10011333_07920 [Sediminivirga luteola]
MSAVRAIARPLLSAAYISNGAARVKDPDASAKTLEPVLRQVQKHYDVPISARGLARATGAAQVAAGGMLALGRMPRLSSAILVATFLIDAAGERFWRESDPQERRESRKRVVTKASLLGGALLAAVDTAGKPGLSWRAQHALAAAGKTVQRTSQQARREAGRGAKDAERLAKQAKKSVGL